MYCTIATPGFTQEKYSRNVAGKKSEYTKKYTAEYDIQTLRASCRHIPVADIEK